MITCPWCGTNYLAFQSNCKNCGGPLPAPADSTPASGDSPLAPLTPPPAPRPVADSYAWKLMQADGWGIVGLIFVLLGAIFTLTGGVLTLGIITAFVGLPFLAFGLAFLAAGVALAATRLTAARQTVQVLREGQATVGTIASVEQNLNVRVNGRNPWTVRYEFKIDGRPVEGRVSTLNPPGPNLRAGAAASVLYLPEAPQANALYPHP